MENPDRMAKSKKSPAPFSAWRKKNIGWILLDILYVLTVLPMLFIGARALFSRSYKITPVMDTRVVSTAEMRAPQGFLGDSDLSHSRSAQLGGAAINSTSSVTPIGSGPALAENLSQQILGLIPAAPYPLTRGDLRVGAAATHRAPHGPRIEFEYSEVRRQGLPLVRLSPKSKTTEWDIEGFHKRGMNTFFIKMYKEESAASSSPHRDSINQTPFSEKLNQVRTAMGFSATPNDSFNKIFRTHLEIGYHSVRAPLMRRILTPYIEARQGIEQDKKHKKALSEIRDLKAKEHYILDCIPVQVYADIVRHLECFLAMHTNAVLALTQTYLKDEYLLETPYRNLNDYEKIMKFEEEQDEQFKAAILALIPPAVFQLCGVEALPSQPVEQAIVLLRDKLRIEVEDFKVPFLVFLMKLNAFCPLYNTPELRAATLELLLNPILYDVFMGKVNTVFAQGRVSSTAHDISATFLVGHVNGRSHQLRMASIYAFTKARCRFEIQIRDAEVEAALCGAMSQLLSERAENDIFNYAHGFLNEAARKTNRAYKKLCDAGKFLPAVAVVFEQAKAVAAGSPDLLSRIEQYERQCMAPRVSQDGALLVGAEEVGDAAAHNSESVLSVRIRMSGTPFS